MLNGWKLNKYPSVGITLLVGLLEITWQDYKLTHMIKTGPKFPELLHFFAYISTFPLQFSNYSFAFIYYNIANYLKAIE